MNDVIKIVYNWIGPRGPIWNTESPNILNFASVGEFTTTQYTPYYWCDVMWDRYFKNKKGTYMLYPASEIEDDDLFIFPFALTWRISLPQYFSGMSGILEYGHTPGHIQHAVKQGKGFFLIDHSVEAFLDDSDLKAMHEYFGGVGYPLHKIIYLTGCMNATEIYDDYCDRYGIPENQKLTVLAYPYSGNEVSMLVSNSMNMGTGFSEPEYNTEHLPEKRFLMWNRRYKPHRIQLLLHMEHINAIDNSYVSVTEFDCERPALSFRGEATRYYHSTPDVLYTEDDVERLSNKLPLVLDGETNVGEMCADLTAKTRPFYQNSLVSIVTETNFHNREITLTEKSFKPPREKHPFIIVGAKGSLKEMQKMGFKTFDQFWSEDYDNIEHPEERLIEIVRILSQINSWNTEKILNFRREVKDILEHNYKILYKRMSDTLAEQLAELVRK